MRNFEQNPHFQAIQDYYGEQRAKRSNVLYIHHIGEGLIVLDAIDATLSARQAYCLHPIVQGDDALKFFVEEIDESNRTKYEAVFVDPATQVMVYPVFVTTV